MSLLTKAFDSGLEWANRWLTISGLFFKSNDYVFIKIEIFMIIMSVVLVALLRFFHLFSFWSGLIISLLLAQRILEYLIIYSRNFISHRGRILTHFTDIAARSQWVILMFFFNLLHLLLVFAIWYRFLSLSDPHAFSHPLGMLNSFYYSAVTFFTIGFGDIAPLSAMAQILTIAQAAIFFYTLVIVINGLIAIHLSFSQQK